MFAGADAEKGAESPTFLTQPLGLAGLGWWCLDSIKLSSPEGVAASGEPLQVGNR